MVVAKEKRRRASGSSLDGRVLYVPQMGRGSAMAFVAAFRSVGVEARLSPDSDEKSVEMAARLTSGEECFPEKVTLGGFLKVIENPANDPARVAFFMPTADGPCRFGQYSPFLKKILKQLKYEQALVFSPTSKNGYAGMGERSRELVRTAWQALVTADLLHKMLLRTRPYEVEKGRTDQVYEESLRLACSVIATDGLAASEKSRRLQQALGEIRTRFREIQLDRRHPRPLIGIVGEIFCRLNDFSNRHLLRAVETHGGECWLSNIAEWVLYTNVEHQKNLRLDGRRFSLAMLGAKIKDRIQRGDEHRIQHLFAEDLSGYEEPADIRTLLDLSRPYLPARGCLGEMVLSVGKAIYLQQRGAAGIIDISPFSCMNGIVSEAVYPAVSRDHGGIPIRNFYFDEKTVDLDRDVGIFMELARHYQKKTKISRFFPHPRWETFREPVPLCETARGGGQGGAAC